MKVKELLSGIETKSIVGNTETEIKEIATDSRRVIPQGMFIAIRGTITDGHKFIEKSIQLGAHAIVCETLPPGPDLAVCWIQVESAARAAGVMAHTFFGRPTEKLRLVGVTGTNGKSTTVTLLYHLAGALGHKAGLISTIENRIGDRRVDATHTTPDPVQLNRLLAQMAGEECAYAFMEVSSHAIHQERIAGLVFAGGVFTNITHDHLDYHGSFREYIEVKKKFFDELGAHAFALVNIDDPRGNIMVQNSGAKVSKFSLEKVSDFRAKVLTNSIEGLQVLIDGVEMMSRLVGRFNAYNLLTAYATAVLLGFEKMNVITALSGLFPAEGRFDVLTHPKRKIHAIVDYAHTPDALEKVMSTLLEIKEPGSRIIVLVGCGGDRDRTKRPLMGRIVAKLADVAIFTSDNPRSEDPEAIIDDMFGGLEKDLQAKVLRNANRKEAIRTAVRLAQKKDLILIAGKGHEKQQEIQGVKYPFDEKAIISEAFKDI